MGRRLNALEELQTSLTDPDGDRQEGRTHLRQQYLERIAETLGITTSELGGHPPLWNAIQPAVEIAQQNEIILTQQCTALIEAFTRITDPQERLRCLQIVHQAAGPKSPESVP